MPEDNKPSQNKDHSKKNSLQDQKLAPGSPKLQSEKKSTLRNKLMNTAQPADVSVPITQTPGTLGTGSAKASPINISSTKLNSIMSVSNLQPSAAVSKASTAKTGLSLSKTDRSKSQHYVRQQIQAGVPVSQLPKVNRLMNSDGKCQRVWEVAALVLSCYIPNVYIEKVLKKTDPGVKQAYREKVALCTISALMCIFLCFFTFFYQSSSCPPPNGSQYNFKDIKGGNYLPAGKVVVYGQVYDIKSWFNEKHPAIQGVQSMGKLISEGAPYDISGMFEWDNGACAQFSNVRPDCDYAKIFSKQFSGKSGLRHCHKLSSSDSILSPLRVGDVYFTWESVTEQAPSGSKSNYMVYNGLVLDMGRYLSGEQQFGPEVDLLVRRALGSDASSYFGKSPELKQIGDCMAAMYTAGTIEKDPILCLAANTILNIALIMICSLVMVRFILAVFFGWFLSWQLGKIQASRTLFQVAAGSDVENKHVQSVGTGVTAATHPQSFSLFHVVDFDVRYRELYTLCLVTAYSEGEAGLRTTIDSLAQTDYHDNYKLIFVVADGVVQGAGNPKPTGDIVLDMMQLDEAMHGPVTYETVVDEKTKEEKKILKCRNSEPQSYKAIGAGSKQHNMAKIYCGTYLTGNRRVAMILVYKFGTPAEQSGAKAGNRGKRDSQIVLMDFLSKIMLNEPLSAAQYDLFLKWSHIMTVQNDSVVKVTPDMFEIVLMVDADTKVLPDSLSRMVSVMQRDPSVMGLCGETRIMNKNESWVSMIQVFEYYTSHHLDKAFESIFGGVTCLPGCFCMYRIKAPKPLPLHLRDEPNAEELCDWIPIISNPDIVADYSESNVDTLHKKNLLLLGEDRYLTTLMLRTFPKRKMMFVPKALCKTQVPAEFQVLLSQRRRWINSTVHNLMELILVRELCGTFCFSMQFVVFLGLVGTATLPAAIIFTLVMIIRSAISEPQWVPLGLLAAILGLPAVLIMLTAGKTIYIYYMLIYLLALPVWNFVLPVYAFWHFDDFSWGQTRQVAGEKKGGDAHGHGGEDEAGKNNATIDTKLWVEWERERRRQLSEQKLDDPFGKVLASSDGLTKYGQSNKRKGFIHRFFDRKPEAMQKSASTKTGTSDTQQKESLPPQIDTKMAKLRPDVPISANLQQQQTPHTTNTGVSSALPLPSPAIAVRKKATQEDAGQNDAKSKKLTRKQV
ncbi:hypothetical protein MP228_002819 [Amoeboaphelidium protococcarum]|nr:hypothetical protein MP228_002819 [Amoeboaphelidium protococcarum]